MPRIPYRYPPKGIDPIADAIRERRGPERGLTPLDGSLLNAPAIANGWNTLLGATRTKNSIPDDLRELMVRCRSVPLSFLLLVNADSRKPLIQISPRFCA